MPPGPVYNWLCVASSAFDILGRVARVRAHQLASEGALANGLKCAPKNQYTKASGARDGLEAVKWRPRDLENGSSAKDHFTIASVAPAVELPAADIENLWKPMSCPSTFQSHRRLDENSTVDALRNSDPSALSVNSEITSTLDRPEGLSIPVSATGPNPPTEDTAMHAGVPLELERGLLPSELIDDLPLPTRQLQSSKVSSSRLGRLFHYGGLAASLGYGAASEIVHRTASSRPDGPQQSLMMTEANITRLVSKLSQMRGAALKLGQFLSIQDTHALPADVDQIFRRVQDSAHYMPDWQMEKVLTSALGPDWARLFTSFDRVPFAAASIGQVHAATLAADVSPTGAEARVAVKVQFPNIANSIASDIGYISLLLTAGRLLPKGLFLERTMQVMKEELADECDYAREAGFLRTFADADHLGGDARFKVPWVWDGSTERVLVMERVEGTSVGEATLSRLDQPDRDYIAALIIELCLKELFHFRLMQTDPNFSNFLWNARTRRLELVDFGSTRAYEKAFIDDWLRLLQAAALDDRDKCIEWSLKLGYLTGGENQVMLDAHVDSLTLLAMPFKPGTPQPFAFGAGTPWADATAQIRARIPVMLQHRLTPPPRQTYSLNRKLSGAFLLAARLGATVDTRAVWEKVVSRYEFTT
ncbi:ABC1-domain-containing protein [Mycena galericulata]|nr:ABC1-domain-containing protein [Mycena galericulata]